MPSSTHLYRKLPSLDELLRQRSISLLVQREGHVAVADAARVVLDGLREDIGEGRMDETALDRALSGLSAAVVHQLSAAQAYSLRAVINATGVILHTNLGRAPLCEAAIRHIGQTAATYSNLEIDLESGERGARDAHVDRLFRRLFAHTADARGGLSTIVVNNNAAAVLLALNTLADGGEVIVSRGELVEIGGSFRIPDVMLKSGAVLREVGATNRTRLEDYETAINPRTRLLLRVHRSNFEISGFTGQPTLDDLVRLSRKHDIPLMEDLGSGALVDLRTLGIEGEPGVEQSLRRGVDLVTYSGDKLLGGPQAGLLSGRSEQIGRMRKNSLFRALRVDKLVYAALEATLMAYVQGREDSVPILRLMRTPADDIGLRAKRLAASLNNDVYAADLLPGESLIGGGAAPSAVLPTWLLALSSSAMSAELLAERLRCASPPVVCRVEQDRVMLDLRTVFPEQDAEIAKILSRF